jgi:hypothetical protein
VDGSRVTFALRELRQRLGGWRVWAAVGLVGAVAGVAGPFGTGDMAPLPRLAYWLAVAAGAWVIGVLCGGAVAGGLRRAGLGADPAFLAAALASGLPIALWVVLLDAATFGWRGVGVGEFLQLVAQCAAIALAVGLGARLAEGEAPAQSAPAPAPPQTEGPPRLLARLRPERRGRLLHLRMNDHYVEVVTDRGRELVLMRMSDAIAETAPVEGLRVHRSHWIAREAVRRAARRDGGAVLELVTGETVPVSRGHLPAVRAAGLLR